MSHKGSRAPSSSVGAPGAFTVSWDTFVESVLFATVAAYEQMRVSKTADPTWEEDLFTVHLCDHLQKVVFPHLQVRYQFLVNTARIKSGTVSPKTASRIDIQLHRTWEPDSENVYFAWECKRVSGAKTPEARKLLTEYVTHGIIRYIKKEYSSGLKDAGMLGYILEGNTPQIISGINKSMVSSRRKISLSSSDYLQIGHSIKSFSEVYTSNHKRSSGNNVHLYHLFLTFDWANNQNVDLTMMDKGLTTPEPP